MRRTVNLRWLLILVLLWQGLAVASMVPQLRAVSAAESAAPETVACHEAAMSQAGNAAVVVEAAHAHGVLESCCDHGSCAVAGLCAACLPSVLAGAPPLRLPAAVPLPQPPADDVATSLGHPFRPPIL